jgi:UDP-N-acetyl-D-mannosaminuronate dehydrogenase
MQENQTRVDGYQPYVKVVEMKQIKLILKDKELTSLEDSDEFEVIVYDYDLDDYENIDPDLIQTDINGEQFIELIV